MLLLTVALLAGPTCGAAVAIGSKAASVREGVYRGWARWPHGEARIYFSVWDRTVRQVNAGTVARCGSAYFDERGEDPVNLRFDATYRTASVLPRAPIRRNGTFSSSATYSGPSRFLRRYPTTAFSGKFAAGAASGRISRLRSQAAAGQGTGSFCDTFGGARWSAVRIRTPWRDGRYRGTIRQRLYRGRTIMQPISFQLRRGRATKIEYRHVDSCYAQPRGQSIDGTTPPLYTRTLVTRAPGPHWVSPRSPFRRPRGQFSAHVIPPGEYAQLSVAITVRGQRASGLLYGHYEHGGHPCVPGHAGASGDPLTARRVGPVR